MIATAIATERYTIRHLLPSDKLPAEVWPQLSDQIDYRWVWVVADDDDRVQTVLMLAPAHGLVIVMRLWSAANAPRYLLRRLFRTVASEMTQLGYRGWMVMLSTEKPFELKIAKMLLRLRVEVVPFNGFVYVGSVGGVSHA